MPSRQRNSKHRSHQNSDLEDRRSNKPLERTANDTQLPGADGKPGFDLQPKISLMSDHTLKLLQEIGELKVFTQADPSDAKQKINKHLDILLALENPQAALSGGTTNAEVGCSRSK